MIRVEHLNFSVGSFALKDLCLEVPNGQYCVLLGPTGSGKTLLIECLCGLNRIDSGRIVLDGKDVTRLEPRARRIGYVPQDYALFGHKTVRENVAFGLRYLGVPQADAKQRVDRLLEQLGIAHLAARHPKRLSGGEKQRVALARALAVRPSVLLLDEPVSAVDEQTREVLCGLLKQLQQSTQTTTLHVCHNFAEMLSVADRVGIIQQGEILQVAPAQEILQKPVNAQVAGFVQAGNLHPAQARDGGQWIELACAGNVCLRALRPQHGDADGDVTLMVRPENIQLAASRPENLEPGTTILQGTVSRIVDLGPLVKVVVECGEHTAWQVLQGKREFNGGPVSVGDQVYLAVAPMHVHVMPP